MPLEECSIKTPNCLCLDCSDVSIRFWQPRERWTLVYWVLENWTLTQATWEHNAAQISTTRAHLYGNWSPRCLLQGNAHNASEVSRRDIGDGLLFESCQSFQELAWRQCRPFQTPAWPHTPQSSKFTHPESDSGEDIARPVLQDHYSMAAKTSRLSVRCLERCCKMGRCGISPAGIGHIPLCRTMYNYVWLTTPCDVSATMHLWISGDLFSICGDGPLLWVRITLDASTFPELVHILLRLSSRTSAYHNHGTTKQWLYPERQHITHCTQWTVLLKSGHWFKQKQILKLFIFGILTNSHYASKHRSNQSVQLPQEPWIWTEPAAGVDWTNCQVQLLEPKTLFMHVSQTSRAIPWVGQQSHSLVSRTLQPHPISHTRAASHSHAICSSICRTKKHSVVQTNKKHTL